MGTSGISRKRLSQNCGRLACDQYFALHCEKDSQAVKESQGLMNKYKENKDYQDRQVIKGKVKMTKERFKGFCKVNFGIDSE